MVSFYSYKTLLFQVKRKSPRVLRLEACEACFKVVVFSAHQMQLAEVIF